jgi:hypothetical protein
MMTTRELAIARSVIYASVFDYPLTLEQLHRTLIESDQSAAEILAVYDGSEMLQHMIEYRDGYFFPIGRADLVAERLRREARSRAFLDRHALVLRLIATIPYTRLVALSGSIAHLNLEPNGDLDLFVITKGPRVWTVTVAVLLLAKLLHRRRAVCANFILADSHLVLEQPDLFTANQVIHLRPPKRSRRSSLRTRSSSEPTRTRSRRCRRSATNASAAGRWRRSSRHWKWSSVCRRR